MNWQVDFSGLRGRFMAFCGAISVALLIGPAAAACTADGTLCCKLPEVLNPETRRCEAMDACTGGTVRACNPGVPAICTCQKRLTCAVRLVWDPQRPSESSIPDAPGHVCDKAGMELAIAAALARLLGAP